MALDKRSALIAEGLSEGEADFLVSGGTKADGLTPPQTETYVEEEAAPPEQTQQTQQQTQQQTRGDEDDNPEPPRNSPFYAQWHREKNKRQQLQDELRTRDERLSQTTSELTDLREKWARIDERMRLFREAAEPPPAAPPAPPDRESDPFGYMAWQDQRLNALEERLNGTVAQTQEERAAAALTSAFRNDAASYAATNPSFWESAPRAGDGAYHFLMRSRDAELKAAGYTDPNERMNIIAADERDIVARAFHARQRNPGAPSPSQVLYDLALSRGYQPRGTAAPAQPAAPANGAANGQARPAAPAGGAPSVTQQVEQIQRGQAASRSLSSAGGAPVRPGIDLTSISQMTDSEYASWKRSLSPAQQREYAAMLGA